ncbi:amino acid permease [Phaffia rhodozyma]|uniref:Amino acid permease n=1 Tax=Phaffia rhodozyma TaxID=264483 RepID=A0A0F7SQ91_PHARH|nr:amino acid permease [Phaffia rhodozyma]
MSNIEDYETKSYEKDTGATHTIFPAGEESRPEAQHLHRGLKSRHMAMISIGGVIGTGLFLGTGRALAHGGPLGLFLGYTIMASVCLATMLALGEMISFLPIEGGHLTLAHRFVDPAWSFALSYNYAYSWLIILPAEISAVAILVQYWTTAYSNAIWISIALAIVIVINLFGARGYGEAEFFFASIKVITIIGLIIVGIAINCGAGPADQGYIGFRYWKNPGPFVQYERIPGSLGKFLGFWAVLTQAAFSFIGTEIVAIAAGEAENPRRNLPKAIRTVYIRIVVFYILGTFIIGLNIPSNNAELGQYSDARASPFVLAIKAAGIKTLPSIINACLITSAWSAASSDMYTSSRAIYSMALNGLLPKVFTRTTKNGLPWAGLIVSSLFGLLAYMSLGTSASNTFDYFVNMTAIAGLMSWLAICVTYLRFRAGMDAQGLDRAILPFKSRFTKVGVYYAIVLIMIVQLFSGWTVFLKDSWDTATFVTNYLPLALFPVLFVFKKFYSKTVWRRAEDMDFVTNIAEIEADSYVVPPHPKWWGRLGNAIF